MWLHRLFAITPKRSYHVSSVTSRIIVHGELNCLQLGESCVNRSAQMEYTARMILYARGDDDVVHGDMPASLEMAGLV